MNNIRIYAFADEAASDLESQIYAMLRNRLNGLEIRGVNGRNISEVSLDTAREIRRRLDENGLKTWSIGSPIGKISIDEPFGAHLDLFRHTLEVAHVLGTENLRMFSFYMPANRDPEQFTDAVIERVGRLVDAARGSGIQLCHENEKGIFGDVPRRCLLLHRTFPSLRGVFDPANFIQCGSDPLFAWEKLKPYIHYMHIKDARTDGKVVPAGYGVGRVPQIVQDYLRMGGRAFTIEPHLFGFDGFVRLERDGLSAPSTSSSSMNFVYPDANTAFDAACNAFRYVLRLCEQGG
jgi:sugar phosphate isomerase/epimerase